MVYELRTWCNIFNRICLLKRKLSWFRVLLLDLHNTCLPSSETHEAERIRPKCFRQTYINLSPGKNSKDGVPPRTIWVKATTSNQSNKRKRWMDREREREQTAASSAMFLTKVASASRSPIWTLVALILESKNSLLRSSISTACFAERSA
jgi:hypothetical protein